MNDGADTIAESIFILQDLNQQTNQDLAVLSMLAIGRIIWAALPGTAEVILERSDQGSFACRTCDADRSLALRMAREADHKPHRATVTLKLDVDVYASGDAAQVKRAICDHLRVISANESVLQLTGQAQPDVQVT